jgi:hypothetical protein
VFIWVAGHCALINVSLCQLSELIREFRLLLYYHSFAKETNTAIEEKCSHHRRMQIDTATVSKDIKVQIPLFSKTECGLKYSINIA